MGLQHSHVTTVVRRVVDETPRIRRFELDCPDHWALPAFTAGAHVDVVLPGGEERQYSLCGDPADRHRYQIAVLRDEAGRGGSRAMHEQVRPGSVLPVSLPRNLFALSPVAQRHVFVAGGVGITPFIAMLTTLERQGVPYELHYCVRSEADIAFAALLRPRVALGRVHFHHPGSGGLDVQALLASPQPGEHAYCCGPARLIEAFLHATAHWPAGHAHHERFGLEAPALATPAYQVRLAVSGRTLDVAANQTLADALMKAGAPVKVACEAGVCGRCKVDYRRGTPVHRDLILTPEERQVSLTTCVSSGECGDLELAL